MFCFFKIISLLYTSPFFFLSMPCPELFLLLLLPVSRRELSEAQVVKLQRSRTPRCTVFELSSVCPPTFC